MDISYIPWPQGIIPRQWQSEFLDDYFTKDKDNYLVYATPGAGKTFAALLVAYQLLRRRIVRQIMVVSPTDNLRTQWINEAEYLGIHLGLLTIDKRSRRAIYSLEDFVGVSVTYAEAHSKKEELRRLCTNQPTFVILDEIHHCGNDEEGNRREWGRSVQYAFGLSVKRLLLSGTPFRNDNFPIPFVKYEPGSDDYLWAHLDYEYGYGRALQDSSGKDYKGVVRPITFPVLDARVGWIDLSGEYEKYLSAINDKERSKALQIILDPQGEYIHEMLKHADGRLNAIRQNSNHKDAGGLIITKDTAHANAIAQVLHQISGYEPIVIHSNMDIENANIVIDKFRRSTDKWIVSVRMISEGVDIKRLRVGIYLTNIHSRVFFMQAVGRVIRWIDGVEMQMAFFYFPQLEPWLTYMREITEVVRDKFDPAREYFGESEAGTTRAGISQAELFLPIYGEITDHGQVLDSQKFDEQTLNNGVEAFIRNIPGVGYDLVRVIGEARITSLAIRAGFMNITPQVIVETRETQRKTKHDEQQDWRRKADVAVKQYASILHKRGQFASLGDAIKAVNTMYGREFGFQSADKSINYYKHKEKWARDQISKTQV